MTGIYQDTLTTINGCDSIIITDLTVLPIYETPISINICEGEFYTVGGANQTMTGIYQDTLTASNGCDSILVMTLTVSDTIIVNVSTDICEGDSILLGGIYQMTGGIYTDSLIALSGCDSIIVTTLMVNPVYDIPMSTSICEGDSILLGGVYQIIGGIYQDSLILSLIHI